MSLQFGQWVEAAITASKDAFQPLGLGIVQMLGAEYQLEIQAGAYIALVGESDSIQLGLLSNAVGHEQIARTMLGVPDGEDLPLLDMVDAVCELINILAGSVKLQMSKYSGELKLALPIYVDGLVHVNHGVAHKVINIKIGEQPAAISVLQNSVQGTEVT